MTMENKHHPFGPSSLRRRELCPGSYRMEEGLPEVESDVAARGTRLHGAIAEMISGVSVNDTDEDTDITSDDMALVTDMFDYFASELRQFGEAKTIATEQRLSYKLYGEELYFGSSDVVLVAHDMATIIDWKTGFREVAPAEDNLQGAAYALAAMQTYGVGLVKVAFYNPVIHQISEHAYTDATGIAQSILGIIETAKAADAPCRPGEEQCRYCKAAAAGCCPAYMAEHEQAVATATAEPRVIITRLNDEQLVDLYERCRLVGRLADNVERELKGRCELSGSICGWGIKTTSGGREAVDINQMFNALKDFLGPDEFLQCCKLSVSQLEKKYAKARKETGAFKTEKDARTHFAELVGELIRDAPERKSLVQVPAKKVEG